MIKDSVIKPIQAPPVASIAKVPDAKSMTLESGATGSSNKTSSQTSAGTTVVNGPSNTSATKMSGQTPNPNNGAGVLDLSSRGSSANRGETPAGPAGPGQSVEDPTGIKPGTTDLEPERVVGVVESLNDYLQAEERNLEFSVDDTTGRTIITVMERESREVIRQIPPEQVIALGEFLRDGGNIETTGIVDEA